MLTAEVWSIISFVLVLCLVFSNVFKPRKLLCSFALRAVQSPPVAILFDSAPQPCREASVCSNN